MLLLFLVDAAAPINCTLHGTQTRTEKCPLASKHARHVAAERPSDQDYNDAEQRDLEPANDGHRKLLEPLWIDQRVDEIDHDHDGRDRAEDVIEQHGRLT